MSNNLEKKSGVISGFIWSFGERIFAQVVSLVVGIILARVLSPDDYGIISIVMVFITICDVFVSSGFGTAIVRKDKTSSVDFNTAFILSCIMSIILYVLVFSTAPFIADFYGMEILRPVTRVFGLRIIVSSFNNIQQAYVQRQMKFKKFFITTFFGTTISCVVGIVMAFKGFGVWALVTQYMAKTIIDTVVLIFVGGWKLRIEFSKDSAKSIYSFGWKMLCSQLIYTLSNNIRSLIIGKAFGSSDLAYYDQGKKYPAVVVDNVNAAISKVMLPTFAKSQNNLIQLKFLLRKSIRIGIYVIAPLMCGFAAVSNNFVHVVLTDKWLSAVPFIQLFCFVYLTRPLEELCHRVLLAIGKSGIVMIIMLIINTISLALTIIATLVFRSVIMIAVFYFLHTLVSLVCFMSATHKHIKYLLSEQIRDICPSISLSLIMALLVYLLGFIKISSALLLIIQSFAGGILYIALSIIFKLEQFTDLKRIVLAFIHKTSCY